MTTIRKPKWFNTILNYNNTSNKNNHEINSIQRLSARYISLDIKGWV